MKSDLTATNFHLGGEEARENTEHVDRYRKWDMEGVTLHRPKQGSSVSFGNDKTSYVSNAADAMAYQGNSNDFAKSKEDIEAMKSNLRKANFSLGEEKKLEGITEYEDRYNSPKKMRTYQDLVNEKDKQRKIIEDTRKAHFNLGQDKVVYQTNTQRAQSASAGVSAKENAENAGLAADIRKKLQVQSIVIGDDPEYSKGGPRFETTTSAALADSTKGGPVDRKSMVDGLRDRKIANTKTSISFGNAKVRIIG
jgi:hypothetical protein